MKRSSSVAMKPVEDRMKQREKEERLYGVVIKLMKNKSLEASKYDYIESFWRGAMLNKGKLSKCTTLNQQLHCCAHSGTGNGRDRN